VGLLFLLGMESTCNDMGTKRQVKTHLAPEKT